MHVEKLDLKDLFQTGSGGPTLGGVRALILDAGLLSQLHRLVGEHLGPAARRILVKLGFWQGWRTASALIPEPQHEQWERWHRMTGQLLSLRGIGRTTDPPALLPFAHSRFVLERSCEAEEYLDHYGRSSEPVCWFAVGFTSGYLTRAAGRFIVCEEKSCAATGDGACEVHATPLEGMLLDEAVDPASDAACGPLLRHLRLEDGGAGEDVDGDPLDLGMQSPGMRKLIRHVDRVAQVDSTVLITGESGVGKERLAQRIHARSRRGAAPFVPVNCGAIAETLWDSELFGHRRGAFTGAINDKTGLIEAANRGTLFLDEVGELPLDMQVKLLRTLQEREVRRVGDTRTIRVDVRVIAATNRDLSADVKAHRFREDLFYRLNVVPFHVPPLRERREDLAVLTRSLLLKISSRMGRRIVGYSPAALARLQHYDWPGNIRELENAIERACALASRDVIDVTDLPEQIQNIRPLSVASDQIRPLREVEREYIQAVLAQLHGNKRLTAERLKIAGTTLYRKMRQYDRSH